MPYSWNTSKEEAQRLPFTNPAFKAEVRQRFGDLRRRATWEAAAIWLLAQAIAQGVLEPYEIVGFMVSADYDPNDPVRQHYGQQVVDAMLTFPGIYDLIRSGLEQIYQDGYTEEQKLVDQFIAAGNELPGLLPAVALPAA